MSKARVVHGTQTYVRNMTGGPTTERHGWFGQHSDCGWFEFLTEWHNAFWAADHHVRYDCGRREQMSSGKYAEGITEAMERWPEARSFHGDPEGWRPNVDAGIKWVPLSEHGSGAPHVFKLEKGPIEGFYEGGMQEDPAPTHMGFPPRGAYTEGPTTDLGAITTEVGLVGDEPWEGFPLEGHTPRGSRGRGAGWWWPWRMG